MENMTVYEVWADFYKIILPILLGIITFFLIRFVRSVDLLREAVSELKEIFAGQSAACKEKHAALNDRIKALDHIIEDIKKELKHNSNHEN